MPTTYPKCSPTELMGLLVLLNDHKGSEDVALLADDLDLEIDEILPAIEFAVALVLLKVSDGRSTLTDAGRKLLAGTIRERKNILREQLTKTTLFKALVRALENAPERRLTEEEVNRLIEFTTAPSDALVQNIINWGRYTELFRWDSDAHLLLPARARSSTRSLPPSRPPAAGGEDASSIGNAGTSSPAAARAADRLASRATRLP
ncbi:MAG: AAA-associated domain-containing protein [Thermoplasmata archaeon]